MVCFWLVLDVDGGWFCRVWFLLLGFFRGVFGMKENKHLRNIEQRSIFFKTQIVLKK